jgi:hypothetical protein
MTSHLGVMMLFAACVSIVFATILRDDAGAQMRFAGRIFLALVLGAYGAGWLMYVAFGR